MNPNRPRFIAHGAPVTRMLITGCMLSVFCGVAQAAPAGGVIEVEELADRLKAGADRGALIVLDMRTAEAYDAGHINGAVRLDAAEWKDESLSDDTGLSHTERWHARIGSAGVAGDQPVVIYDDGRMTEAARVWFIFQHFGVADVAVLNGGFPALKPLVDAGSISLSTIPTPPKPVVFRPSAAARGTIELVERERVRRFVEEHKAQVLDARTPAEYSGDDLRKNTRGGHLPSAINLPHKDLLDESGRLKTPGALVQIFESAGFQRGQPVITHCDGGGRASLAALAAERAGFGPVMNYYLSFGDWAADATCPVEKP